MQQIDFEIDFGAGFLPVTPPKNWKEMKVQLIFTGAVLQAQLQSINFEWVNKTAADIIKYINNGKTGGIGIFEGPGLRVFVGKNRLNIFDGCLDTASRGLSIENGIVKCPIKESGKIDWLNDTTRSITFEYLANGLPLGAPGKITHADYKKVPYCISTIPNYSQAALLSITLFMMVKESVDVICKITSLIARMVGQAGNITWVQLLASIVELILYSIYLLAIVASSMKLLDDIANNIIQEKKIKLAMREQDLWIKLCDYFGLRFSSTIYGVNAPVGYNGKYVNATWMPKKVAIPIGDPVNNIFKRPFNEVNNVDSFGYYEGTAKRFIDDMSVLYNAQPTIRIDPITRVSTLHFEEVHYMDFKGAFKLPNHGDVGYTFNYPQPYSTNASELAANYELSFQKDSQDLNTYNDYSGTYCIAQLRPKITRNIKNNLLSGAVRIDLPCALARRKAGLSKIELDLVKIYDQFAKFLSAITKSSDKINNQFIKAFKKAGSDKLHLSNDTIKFAAFLIQGTIPVIGNTALMFGAIGTAIIPQKTYDVARNRVGWMLLSSDFMGVPKRFIGEQVGDDWLISKNNESVSHYNTPLKISGTFTGISTITLPTFVFNAPVWKGIITVQIPTAIIGPAIAVVTGAITGQKGLFTAIISGTGFGGIFTGSAYIMTKATGVLTTVTAFGDGSARSLMEDFHRLNMAKANTGNLPIVPDNQWLPFKDKKFKFSEDDFIIVNNNNVFTTPDNKEGKFDKLVWDIHNDEAINVEYRILEKYTDNLTLTITDDGG